MEHNDIGHKLDGIMKHYSEAMEEIMGAQAYAKRAYHAESPEIRAEYVKMARQELEHADALKRMGHMEAKGTDILMTVWNKHQEHLDRWKDAVLEKIKGAEAKQM